MTWLYLALMAPVLWSLSNIVDKFAINNITSHYIPFVFLLSIGNIFFAAVIYLVFFPQDVELWFVVFNLLSGLAIFGQYFAYSYSLEQMDVSAVIPIHQSEPVFVLIASVLFFHSIPSEWQIFGFFLIIAGILLLSVSRQTVRGLGQSRHVVVLLISALFGAISTLISDFLLISKSLETVLIFNFAGYSLGGALLLLWPAWRALIINDLSKLSLHQFCVFGLTNIFDVGGYVFFMAALAVGGGAALVAVIVSIHPLFVLILGYIVTKFFPKLFTEDIAPGGFIRKLFSIVVIVAGVSIISIT